jgi:hypothetical protein
VYLEKNIKFKIVKYFVSAKVDNLIKTEAIEVPEFEFIDVEAGLARVGGNSSLLWV